MIAYFNGEFLPKEEIFISPDDRGFLFADGLYEVIRTYDGTLFCAKEHILRLNAGAAHLRLPVQDFSFLEDVAEKLIQKNGLTPGDATVYIQVTRGVAPRQHNFPSPKTPVTVFASAKAFDAEKSRGAKENGVPVIMVPDQRWARCDMKTVGLTANILANQEAMEKGAKEALFVRDGVILEGSHSNFMAVMGNCLVTAPATNTILHGITRQLLLTLCDDLGIEAIQAPIFVSEQKKIKEAFITGTTTEITPVVSIDGTPVGDGLPGPVTQRLQQAFNTMVRPG